MIFSAAPAGDLPRHGIGEVTRQTNLSFQPQGRLFYRPQQAEDAWVELPFTVESKKPRRLLMRGTRARDYGRYQAYLNGAKLSEPLDMYSDHLSDWEWHLLDFWPEPGEYTLRLECVGKHPQSTGHYLGVESVRLRERRPRVKKCAHDKDKDWREEPVLYQ